MPTSAPGLSYVTVRATLPAQPFPALADRPPLVTERLLIRAPTADDLAGLHEMRTEPDTMVFTAQGVVDTDIEQGRKVLARYLPPNDATTFNFSICLRETGEFIGMGGCHMVRGELGWPVIGYMFRKAFWGRGYATEFVRAFVAAWWALPREEREVSVEAATVLAPGVRLGAGSGGPGEETESARGGPVAEHGTGDGADARPAEELLTAITAWNNPASQRILAKCGFGPLRTWTEADFRDPTGQTPIELRCFGCTRPQAAE